MREGMFSGVVPALLIVGMIIGGIVFIGGEHLILWAVHHVHVSWSLK